jgi:hypothetical protein
MKVIALINGQITSEVSAIYALHYAKVNSYELELIHFLNNRDELVAVQRTIMRIKEMAKGYDIACHSDMFNNTVHYLIQYTKEHFVDTIFCATRIKKSFFSDSFSSLLIKLPLRANIAIARIVHVSAAMSIDSLLLPIEDDRLSVMKFHFFSSLVQAYEAQYELYSIKKCSTRRLSNMLYEEKKEAAHQINQQLRHYQKLSHFMHQSMHITHTFSPNFAQEVIEKSIHSPHQLIVIGAKRLSFFSPFLKRSSLENIMSKTHLNAIAFYPQGFAQ